MPSIPGYCPHCGAVFDGRGGIHIGNSTGVVTSGNRMTCPRCGRLANLVDGTFNAKDKKLELVSGPPLTRAVIGKLEEIARQAKAHEITAEEAVKQIAEVDPVLGRLISRYMVTGLPLLALIVSIIALYLQYQGNIASDEFERKALLLMERQVQATEMLSGSKHQQSDSSVNQKGEGPSEAQANQKSMAVKRPSHRRKDVNAARRKAHIERRRAFPRHRK
jgi:hypothetical protein